MKRLTMMFSSLACLVGTLSIAGVAAAQQCPASEVIFLFDQSASMNGAGSTGSPKYQIGLAKAQADFAALPAGTEVGVIGFGNLPPIGSTPYTTLYVELREGKKKGTDDTELLGQIASAAIPGPMNTPFAGGACDALTDLLIAQPTCLIETTRQLYVYTDGLENSTPSMPLHECYSALSSTAPFDASKAGMGFGLDAGSWQRKVANKAWTGVPDVDHVPGAIPIVTNVSLLFDFVGLLSTSSGLDGPPAGVDLQSVDANGIAFFKGIAQVTNGSFFEAKKVNGVATVIPVPGDTDPAPTSSCVNAVDINRVLTAFGKRVVANDPVFSQADLAKRDVNNDLVINAFDYQVVLANYGVCH
jgi:hypothetical protein